MDEYQNDGAGDSNNESNNQISLKSQNIILSVLSKSTKRTSSVESAEYDVNYFQDHLWSDERSQHTYETNLDPRYSFKKKKVSVTSNPEGVYNLDGDNGSGTYDLSYTRSLSSSEELRGDNQQTEVNFKLYCISFIVHQKTKLLACGAVNLIILGVLLFGFHVGKVENTGKTNQANKTSPAIVKHTLGNIKS